MEEPLVVSIPSLVRLVRHRGRDLVADRSNEHWLHFEDPLPLAVAALTDLIDGCFYDVGANTGYYSVLVGRLHPEIPVRAFEPVPAIAEHFAENMAVNDLPIEVERVALSDRAGTAELYLPPADHGLIESSASLDPTFKDEIAEVIEVTCEPLDAARARLGDERIGFVKIDVEGAEELVLAGATECLRRDRPLIAVELLPRARFDRIAALLADYDYRLLSMRPGLQVAVEDTPRFVAESWNQLLVPSERLAEVTACLERAAQAAAGEPVELSRRERLLRDNARVERCAGQAELEELARAEAELRATSAQVEAELRGALARTEAQRDEAIGERNRALARVDELTRSTSWRVTGPLRRISSALARGTR